MSTCSDAELITAWRAGDRSAGSVLFDRHFGCICRFFRNKVQRDVEELVQRTFMGAVEGRDRFREEASFRTYLFAIAHNVLRAHFRKLGRVREVVDVDSQSLVDLGESPSALLAAKGEQKLLLHGLRRIPLESQVLLELYYWERLTIREVGVFLGVSEETGRNRLRKARRLLVKAIHELEASPSMIESTVSNLDAWAADIRGKHDVSAETPVEGGNDDESGDP